MDGDGRWFNEHGIFEHPKIIRYFNESIHKDEGGYYLSQVRDQVEEKVYFPYEATALFVVDIDTAGGMVLLLNNKTRLALEPGRLFLKNDSLYMGAGDDLVKFKERALLKLSIFMEEKEGELRLTIDGKSHVVEGSLAD